MADTLLPLGAQIVRLLDPNSLRGEGTLSPMPSATKSSGDGGEVSPLLAHLAEAKQWVIYGLLLHPEDLGEPGAIDVLIAVLNAQYVLPVYGADSLEPHREFEQDSKTLAKWLKNTPKPKDEAKRFQALLKESRSMAYRAAGPAHATMRHVLVTKLSLLASPLLMLKSDSL